MSVVAPPSQDEQELLIREARARQRRRWMLAAAVVTLLAGAVLGINSIVHHDSSSSSSAGGPVAAVRTGKACGVRVDDMRILDSGGGTLYREPGSWTPSYPHPSVVRCSGATDWVVWDNGAASSQEGYVGVRSTDAGRTWKLVFAESYFGVKAPHQLDSYLGPWTLRGPSTAYFTGWCPACGGMNTVSGTTSLWVTKNRGRTFREYKLPALVGYEPIGIRVAGRGVAITAKGFFKGDWRRKTVTLRAA